MFHCKIARTEKEFTAIARLNYETFVEEISQHEPNESRLLIDKFHNENTYIVLYKDDEIIGMLAFRDKRPFSIDMKIGDVEEYLASELCTKMCEVRLLAIKKEHRVGRVFLRLAQALYAYVLGKGYSACVISGVTSQEHLYKHIGFWQFAEAVGTDDAKFLPMVLTSKDGQAFYEQFQRKHAIFYPGPVQQILPLQFTTVSHRSEQFKRLYEQVKTSLLQLTEARHVALLNGSGTLANDVMLMQIKARVGDAKGFICSNGEFGNRLIQQAASIGLKFDVYEEPWGTAFNEDRLATFAQRAKWCLFVHGETSTGMLNELEPFIQLQQQFGFLLAVDCISSFGAVPFSLQSLDFATATSGKAIGAIAGLSFVFYKDKPISHGPRYSDLQQYHKDIPFTLPAYLLANVREAFAQYPERFSVLQDRLQNLEELTTLKKLSVHPYPTAVSYSITDDFLIDAQLNGFELHAESNYLKQRKLAQISTIQPTFDKDFGAFVKWLKVYDTIQ